MRRLGKLAAGVGMAAGLAFALPAQAATTVSDHPTISPAPAMVCLLLNPDPGVPTLGGLESFVSCLTACHPGHVCTQ